MNPVIENMKKRHSVRLFEQKPIPKSIINMIIEAGNLAPSTGNTKEVEEGGQKKNIIDYQPWRFVVVEDPEFMQILFQTIEPIRSNFYEGLKESVPEMYDQAMMLTEVMEEPKDLVFYSAPVIIYVIGPTSNSLGCAMVCENIMLAAVSFGLGSCYVGFGAMVKSNAEVVKALDLKGKERIYGPIVLGYPKVNPSEKQVRILEELRSKKKEPQIKWI
ncbi:nitroreductase family protein [Thermoproteota archaeon]